MAANQSVEKLSSDIALVMQVLQETKQIVLAAPVVCGQLSLTLADGFGVLVEVLKALATPEGEH